MPPVDVCHLDARCLDGQRTGIGVFTAEVAARWPGGRLVLHRDDGAAQAAEERRHGAPWHLRTALTVRREGGAYLSTDSLIVPVLLGHRATVVVHDLAPLLHPGSHHRRARAFFRLLLGAACRRAGAVVVPSEATRADLVRRYPGVAGRVHVAAEAPRRLPAPAALPTGVRPPFVLHAGTHEPRKNVVALVSGFLSHPVPEPWQLVLAGRSGWLSRSEQIRLDELIAGSGGRVLRLGFVPDAVLAALYASAGLFAYPSAYEGFGLPVIEAMQAGVPVVTSSATALAEIAGGAALVVPLGAGLDRRLGAALAGVACNEQQRSDLASRGRARAASFDWGRTAAAVHAAVASTQPGLVR